MELISILNFKKKASVERAKKGNKDEFLALINENKLSIYKVAKGILNNKYDIEDAIQNTIIRAYEKINTLKNNDLFKTWIIRILINECNEIIRKNKRVISLDEGINQATYNDVYEDIDLTRAISMLCEELRTVTVLFYFEDMSSKDIAIILDIPEGTVRSRLSRARQQLRKVVEEVDLSENV
ncbi:MULTISPECIES: sigma-70 family RNA polymerase sigma factor [Clostridium]|uniref:sigma-70 family RNA polymerase sigma factor n=1 Tax=Clostridium TaxID=1485 RepID=UPI00189896B0|nr:MULTISPECIES: sigma-70 family RNA polymerase sigma factor [Clostridium]MCR1950963.1 sigma-70 family RNA polymerase sigma factor [Clostridium sp. DSM 100503]MDI9217647.1 sigma-70 family RNA polymerase sigma factor [Clostridium tertium]